MKPQPLRTRVLGALLLQPMTVREIARCLSCRWLAAHNALQSLMDDGTVVREWIKPRTTRRAHAYRRT